MSLNNRNNQQKLKYFTQKKSEKSQKTELSLKLKCCQTRNRTKT